MVDSEDYVPSKDAWSQVVLVAKLLQEDWWPTVSCQPVLCPGLSACLLSPLSEAPPQLLWISASAGSACEVVTVPTPGCEV